MGSIKEIIEGAKKVLEATSRYKGTAAMTKRADAARGPRYSDNWTNLETLGSVNGDRSAGGIVYKNGEPVKMGNVGRPPKKRISSFMLKLIDDEIKSSQLLQLATRIVNGTHVRQPDIVRSRGRISSADMENLFDFFDKLSVSVPQRSSLTGNALRTASNRFRHWNKYIDARTALYKLEIASGNKMSAAKLGQLRQRIQGIEKKMRLNGWDPEEFKIK